MPTLPAKVNAAISVCFIAALIARAATQPPTTIDTPYVTMSVSQGWTVADSKDAVLVLKKGKYLLTIDPVFTHASGVIGGRFYEITGGMKAIPVVMRAESGPPSPSDCATWPPETTRINDQVSLANLYTDSSIRDADCKFPQSGKPAWFGAYASGDTASFGSPSNDEFSITLDYETDRVDDLPGKGSSSLKQTLAEVAGMLKTLRLKPPIIVSKIEPEAGPPGTSVTLYGRGFDLFRSGATVVFKDFANEPMPSPVVAPDGESLVFQVLSSTMVMSCRDIVHEKFCPPQIVGDTDLSKLCPQLNHVNGNFCGVAIPPGEYQLTVNAGSVASNPVSFTITAPESTAVSISVVYPAYLVAPRQEITVIGNGFTATGNTVRIGSATVENVPSADGKTITFKAPIPDQRSRFFDHLEIYKMSVSNANGQSNLITFWYQ